MLGLRTWPIRYSVSAKLSRATDANGTMLSVSTDSNRSNSEPCFRNLLENPAYGPNSSECWPPMIRASRCGTDIGGEPTEALP